MSDVSVTERRIRPIQDAVASKNWKQALKECDKWQKKGEKSDKFLALKAFVLVNQPDHVQNERGLTETLQLCHRKEAVVDVEAIHFLQDALKNLSIQQDEGPKLWDRAAAARPSDQGLLMKWLHGSVAKSDWISAQKAAMALRKAFPKDRQYEFWNILMYFLVHKDVSVPKKQRELFGTLAYRLITKAAESIPTDPEQLLSPEKAIATVEELYLLVHIYLDTGYASEAVDLLLGQSLNQDSHIGQQDPPLVTALLLKALESSKRWSDALTVCKKLIEKPEHRGDDQVWKLLFKAGSDPQLKDEYATLVNDHATKIELRDRPAQLTRLKNLRTQSEGSSIPYPDILAFCTEYYRLYEDKSFCFDDLKDSLEVLDDSHQLDCKKFLEDEVAQKPSTMNRLFQLKFERLLKPHSAQDQEPILLARSSRAIALYNSSILANPACPEAGLLAAMDLLLISTLNSQKSTSYHLRAILLLELFHSKFEDYYPYTILLIQSYISIGLLSSAIQLFIKLSVKNLQYENVAHLLLTRISSLHPRQHGVGEASLNPAGALEAGLKVLNKSTDALNYAIRDGLKYGSYANIIDSVQLKGDLERSLNRKIYALEQRKIGRLMGDVEADESTLAVRVQDTVDKRDFSFFQTYSSEDGRIHDMLRIGPLIGDAWVDGMALVQYFISFLKGDTFSVSGGTGKLGEFVARAGPPDRIRAEMTASEYLVYEVTLSSHDILENILKGEGSDTAESLHKIKTKLDALIEENAGRWEGSENESAVQGCVSLIAAGAVKVPGWRYLHTSFLLIELGNVVAAFVAWCERYSKAKGKKSAGGSPFSAPEVLALKTSLGLLEESIKENAKRVKRGLGEGGVLGKLVDVVMARDEEGAEWKVWREQLGLVLGGDEGRVETAVGGWMEAWEDGLDGIVGVKSKWGK